MPCNHKCTNWKAKKPAGIGQYASGQIRCDTCQIFMYPSPEHTHNVKTGKPDVDPKNGLACNCCNSRISTRAYSAKYGRYQDQNNSKNFEQLLTYIQDEMVMQENFQPVILRKLLKSKSATKEELDNELDKYSKDSKTPSSINTVLDVLQRERNQMIRKEEHGFVINSIDELSEPQSDELIDACNKRLEKFEEGTTTKCWIWSVTPENWEIIKEKNIWASKIGQKIRDKVRPGDKVIFYVLGTNEFRGILEFVGEWYDATEPAWLDEVDSIIHQSQIKLKPIKIGAIKIYDIANQLKMFSNPDDKRLINLVLKGGGGYPSNNGKPIVYEDYKKLLELIDNSTSDIFLSERDFENMVKAIPLVVEYNKNKLQSDQRIPKAEDIQLCARLQYYCALRIAELLKIIPENIDLEDYEIKISNRTNSNSFSTTTIHPTLKNELEKYLKDKTFNKILFPFTSQLLWSYYKKAGQFAELNLFKKQTEREIEGMSTSILRNSRGRHMLEKDAGEGLTRLKLRINNDDSLFNFDKHTLQELKDWEQREYVLSKENFEELTGSYYIITQNEGSRYNDIPGKQYAYDSDKSHYKNFLKETNFIVQTKIDNKNYFIGHGKVGNTIAESPRVKENGRRITDIVAKFSEYTEFPERKIRTEEINKKMLDFAFPSGNPNIPPAMLPIDKDFYDEIIYGKTQKISENEKITPVSTMIDDDLESLIKKFDANRNLFYSEWISEKNESLKIREDFVAKFPIDKINEMLLDSYVIGKPDETTGGVRRNTFSYMLEVRLPAFGRIKGRWSRFHGIYWRKETKEYVWNGDFENSKDAFSEIKNQIFSMLSAAQILEQSGDWIKFSEYMVTQGKTVMANVKSKILSVYFPQIFLNLHKKALLIDILDELEITHIKKSSRYTKEKSLLDYKNNHPIMKNWDNVDYSHFLWFAILKKIDEDEIEPEEFEVVRKEELPEKTFDDKQIHTMTADELKKGLKEISDNLLIPKKKVMEIINALASGHIILAGPIGTGKTELARTIPKVFWSTEGGYFSDIYTATADWNTQDVIGGIVPKMSENDVIYKIQDGCITESVRKNWIDNERKSTTIDRHAYRGVWAIIDEFNRADIDKAFGQLFTALRTKEMKIPSDHLDRTFDSLKIPKDFRIIGTLNTADKHYLFPLSDALKSRFAIIEIDVPEKKLKDKEIFYALKHAMEHLELKEHYEVILDVNKKIILSRQPYELFPVIYQAYNFLSFVRQFNKLGTAILKIIYQNLLTGHQLKADLNDMLDNSINSTIIPQLEKLSELELGAINAVINGKLLDFLKDVNKTNKRHNSSKVFSKILKFLNLNSEDYEYFSERELKEDDKLWKEIENSLSKLNSDEEKLPGNLEQTSKSLESLMEQSII